MMRQQGAIRRRFFSLLFVLIMLVSTASAEGLFPSMNQLFGTAMPSIEAVVGRSPAETGEDGNGKYEVYTNFSYDDYSAFGAYLAGVGATVTDTEVSGSAMKASVSARGAAMQFMYDWNTQTAAAIYPSGTRPETEKEAVEVKASILPPVGGIMPSAQFAVGRKPDSESRADNGTTQVWTNFTDADYNVFSTYLAQTGATLKQSSAEGGILTAEISLNASSFTLTYDWHTKTATVLYPIGTSPEREKLNTLKGSGSILPKMETIGKDLPSISRALSREPDTTEVLADGSRQEIYNSFDEADYNVFSQYLQTAGCAVDDYHVEGGSVMVIQLSNLTGTFTFTYDALRHIGSAVYPKASRIEKAWAAPTAVPTPKVTATPKPSRNNNYYSESECWSIAERYFRNMRWNDPSSVTIYGHTSSYNSTDSTYTFTIDYTARVVAGGLRRSYYWISVSAITGQVNFAFGGN